VKNFEHRGNCDVKTIRFIVIDCLTEDQGLRIRPMKLRTGDHGEDRSRSVDTPDVVGTFAGSGEKGKV
jgi:hypothetical protein